MNTSNYEQSQLNTLKKNNSKHVLHICTQVSHHRKDSLFYLQDLSVLKALINLIWKTLTSISFCLAILLRRKVK